MKLTTGLVLAGYLSATTFSLSAASLEGTFNIVGAVTFSLTPLMDWGSNGPSTGTFATSSPATGDFAGIAVPLPGLFTGTAKDYTGTGPVPRFLDGFTSPGFGGLYFDLSNLVASVAPPCSTVSNPGINVDCSFHGLTLKNATEGMTIDFAVQGYFQNGADITTRSDGEGIYTSQKINGTVLDFVQALNAGGFRDASYSAEYSASGFVTPNETIPEPSTSLLIVVGGGLILAGARKRSLFHKR